MSASPIKIEANGTSEHCKHYPRPIWFFSIPTMGWLSRPSKTGIRKPWSMSFMKKSGIIWIGDKAFLFIIIAAGSKNLCTLKNCFSDLLRKLIFQGTESEQSHSWDSLCGTIWQSAQMRNTRPESKQHFKICWMDLGVKMALGYAGKAGYKPFFPELKTVKNKSSKSQRRNEAIICGMITRFWQIIQRYNTAYNSRSVNTGATATTRSVTNMIRQTVICTKYRARNQSQL